jgi:hypothetical protein
MWLRKALYWWQFAAVIVMPTVVLIARGVLGSSLGWDFVLYLVLSPILGAFMLLVAGLTAARGSVRQDRAVGWLDAGVIVAWHASIVAFALLDSAALATIVVVIAVAAFWIAVWQLVTETGRRMRSAVRDFGTEFAGVRDEMRMQSPSVQVGEVIVIPPADESTNPR